MLRGTKRKLYKLGTVCIVICVMLAFMYYNQPERTKNRSFKHDKNHEKKMDNIDRNDNANKNDNRKNSEQRTGKDEDDNGDNDDLDSALKKLEKMKEDSAKLFKSNDDNANNDEDFDDDADEYDEDDYDFHGVHKYHIEAKDPESGINSEDEDDGEEGKEDEEGAENEDDEEDEDDDEEDADDEHEDEEHNEHDNENADEGEEEDLDDDDEGYGNDNDDDDGGGDDEYAYVKRRTDRGLLSYDDYDDWVEDEDDEYTYYADSENTIMDVHSDTKDEEEAMISDEPGEMGVGVYVNESDLAADDLLKYRSLYRQHGFNGFVSDLISANRSLPDVRNDGRLLYDTDPETTELPTASVIICFHNEALSVLLRTVVSVLNRSPDSLLEEIILIDDNSTLGELSALNNTLSSYRKVRLIRTSTHEGLIRARLLGVQHAKAPVLVFLDSHVECFQGWLEPLLERLTEKRNTVVCPQIQTISEKSFKIMQNDQVYVGNLILSDLSYDWVPVQARDISESTLETQTVRSPTFAGGLFAIFRTYFEEIGSYDEQMDLWGGENIEMSLRVWMCGGTVEVHPCSNVAHIFRNFNPLEHEMDQALTRAKFKNNLRVASVWLDDYIKYYYEYDNMKIKVSPGDVSHRKTLKEDLRCETFQWYIDNVYPGIYIPGQAIVFGKVVNTGSGKCLTSLVDVVTSRLGTRDCGDDFFQYWQFSKLGALQREIGCAAYRVQTEAYKPNLAPTIEKCNGGGINQNWLYTEDNWMYHPDTDTCMASTDEGLAMLPCQHDIVFEWSWSEMKEPKNPFFQ